MNIKESRFIVLVSLFSHIVAAKFLFLFGCSARPIKRSGECGVLYVAEPLDACGPLTNQVGGGSENPFALIIRGGCTFDAKVRSAQNAGFKAAIVYDNEDSGVVISSKSPCARLLVVLTHPISHFPVSF